MNVITAALNYSPSQSSPGPCNAPDLTITIGKVYPDNSFDISVIAPLTAASGQRAVTCYQTGMNNPSIYVYDATPVITSVTPPTVSPGVSTTITVFGHNFGSNPTVNIGGVNYYGAAGIALLNTQAVSVSYPVPSDAVVGSTIALYITSTGENGSPFQSSGGSSSANSNVIQIPVAPLPHVSLTQIGWSDDNRQGLWKTGPGPWSSNSFGSNGDTKIPGIVWVDPNGDGHVTVNEPAAFLGGFSPTLKGVALKLDQAVSLQANLRVVVQPPDFVFPETGVTFVNGTASVPEIVAAALPARVTNQSYVFTWSLQTSPSLIFQQFQQTTHHIFITKYALNDDSAEYRVTAKRLDYVSGLANGLADLNSIVLKITKGLVDIPGLYASTHIANPNNLWTAIDPPYIPIDCISASGIGAVELQQLGLIYAGIGLAYPTGALPPGDTDATTQETMEQVDLLYQLSFSYNVFEGYIDMTGSNGNGGSVNPPTAYTVLPRSGGPIGLTGCSVSPATPQNQLAFHVLSNTYLLLSVGGQQWLSLDPETHDVVDLLPQQYPLPLIGCSPADSNPI